jgi:hypothetical protein
MPLLFEVISSHRRETASSEGQGSRRIGEGPRLGRPHTIHRLLSAAVIQTDTKP